MASSPEVFATLEDIADLAPGPAVAAFLTDRPHLISFLESARDRLLEVFGGVSFQATLRLAHEGDGVVLIARLEGSVEEARESMRRFDDWLHQLPRGWDDGVTVDVRASRL